MDEQREITYKDFENVIERYLYTKRLNENDKYILANLPFYACTGFENNPKLKKRYEKHLRKLALSDEELNLASNWAPDYLMIDTENEKEWYHPKYGDLLPPLENPKIVTLYDANNKRYVIEGTIGSVERTLLRNGYRFIRNHNFNRAVYFRDDD